MSNKIHDILGEQGLFSQLPNFTPRLGQVEMSQAIAVAMQSASHLMVEAGTGTGKTYAYLVPALLSDQRVIISTATKNLQDQLFHKDLPLVKKLLKSTAKVKLLKGRANYLCWYYMELATSQGLLIQKEDSHYLQVIQKFASRTQTGDKADLPDVPEDSTVWPIVTSTKDNCLGMECPEAKRCFVLNARKEAMDADIVVVNHHLFFADMMLKDTGMAELLPSTQTIIFDEAHELPQIATNFLGETVTMRQVIELSRDARMQGLQLARDGADWSLLTGNLENKARDLRAAVMDDFAKWPKEKIVTQPRWQELFDELVLSLNAFDQAVGDNRERDPAFEQLHERTQLLKSSLLSWQQDAKPVAMASETSSSHEQAIFSSTAQIQWGDFFNKNWQLHTTPLSVAPNLKAQMQLHGGSWIFVSATLTGLGEDFRFFADQIGLEDATSLSIPSPFDYRQQAVIYAPPNLPDVHADNFHKELTKEIIELIKTTGGRTVILTTTLRAIDVVCDELEQLNSSLIENQEVPFNILSQGQRSKSILVQQFQQEPRSILIGSQSFWVGVDLPGTQLVLLVIDKLPFAPPDDPVQEAKIDALKRAGKNAFYHYQLPRALLSLKQGVGRLIRSETDFGVVVIADKRLIEKSYGRELLESLPRFSRTRDKAKAIGFLTKKIQTIHN